MSAVRQSVRWLAGVWLCSQLAMMAVTSATLCAGRVDAAAPACTCVHADNATCPMHHPAQSRSTCNCRSNTPDPASLTVVSLLGPVAVMPTAITALAEPPITQLPTYPINKFTVAPAAPDGPPPRA